MSNEHPIHCSKTAGSFYLGDTLFKTRTKVAWLLVGTRFSNPFEQHVIKETKENSGNTVEALDRIKSKRKEGGFRCIQLEKLFVYRDAKVLPEID